jgi:hypothetical protein
MNALMKTGVALSAFAILAGCSSTNLGKANPFGKSASETPKTVKTPAPIVDRTGTLSETQVGKPAHPSYVVPKGGPNTFSLSVSPCVSDCEIVNVMLDPDNYWQRTSSDSVTTGQGRAGLYDDVTNAFQAQGFYAFQGALKITEGSEKTCPNHEANGQAFYISLSRNSGARTVTFDTGCAGSASADGAADAINTLVTIGDYMAIVDGSQPGMTPSTDASGS